jgi:hypothetical protein
LFFVLVVVVGWLLSTTTTQALFCGVWLCLGVFGVCFLVVQVVASSAVLHVGNEKATEKQIVNFLLFFVTLLIGTVVDVSQAVSETLPVSPLRLSGFLKATRDRCFLA